MNSSHSIISSTANEKAKRIRAFSLKKNRDAEGVFVVEGAEHVQKALANSFQIETLLFNAAVKSDSITQEIIKSSSAQNAEFYEINDKVATYASNRDNAQGVIAVFKQKYHDIKLLEQGTKGLWLGLENVRDPGNLGTIIRTADAIGAQGIILIGNTCDAFSPEVIRATTGSFSAIPLIKISAANFITARKKFAGTVVGTHLHQKAVDYRQLKTKAPT
jgi:TrmH family RNA methyltransferase